MKKFRRLLQRPIKLQIQMYPESFLETMEKPWLERYCVIVDSPDSPLPLAEWERVLRYARRHISTQLREVQAQLYSPQPENE